MSLLAATRRVLLLAIDTHRGDPATVAYLRTQLARLDEPLRVAIAGKVKAGKSTLLNALVGENIAPTDAGECTRVVTWYRDGSVPRIVLHPHTGHPEPLTVRRTDGALVIDLDGTPVQDVDRLVVDWPSESLRAATLIDTPGIASTSAATSQRTVAFLDPDDDTPTEADAVVYLMRHLHAADAEFLESFRDRGVARATAVNTVAVISRADEIGGGRVDAMFSARGIAGRYRSDPTVRGLCQDVVAVAGLLAQTGRTLRHAEYTTLAALAALPREELDSALLSVARFRRGPDAELRDRLVRRFGLFGIRLSAMLIRQGTTTPDALAAELVARSGLTELQNVLHTRFTGRRDLLKARSALLAVDRLLQGTRRDGPLAREVERVLAGAHEFAELRLLGALRSGAVGLPRPAAEEAERLLGDAGAAPTARLGLPPDAPAPELRHAAFAALERWQRHAANPMLTRVATDACHTVIRTCEGILAAGSRPVRIP
ncbi:dynamin family protein [Pseudonocardia abyssalis]|uniref:Dynamin family protein n=1 Tax=Pseudonocardia abyssalis TaxID=2792008 RepID=A0ABS6UTU2_9PSEU|nr:dynamin family protein [Pseudonocardia abyssalis]MBW0116404.1 dynamin family protein [Pseudonocardia abyssalis]MBW0135678.1 dynamin family protein [Pseudonocardia abyssalis]